MFSLFHVPALVLGGCTAGSTSAMRIEKNDDPTGTGGSKR